jgi:ATP-dependent DNA ligase
MSAFGGKADMAWTCRNVLALEGIVSKKINAPYRSGPSKSWIKVKNPKAPAATRNPA